MTDTPDNAAPAAGAAPQPQQITSRVLAQYIRDMSFENILAQKGVKGDAQPEVQVQVNLDARKRTADHQFEVITKLNITSKTKAVGEPLFVLEIEYAGVFHVEGVPEEQMHPYLLIECPRITSPFLRRSTASRPGSGAGLA